MKHLAVIVSALCLGISAYAQTVYRTEVKNPDVRSLRIRYEGNATLQRPILTLGTDEVLEISFDELSHNTHNYTYTLLHLNADRTESSLSSVEYLAGFPTADITDYDYSLNTQQLYTHYRFTFPNEEMQPKISGNYALKIYEDGDPEKVVAYACFAVVEPKTGIEVTVRHNTDIELSGRYQQLDIDVLTQGIGLRNPDEIKVVVRQNNRTDNEVFNPKPSYVESQRLRYLNHKQLIFEGGNEYRHFDISSVYFMGNNVDYIRFDQRYYQAFLFPDENRSAAPYLSDFDTNGQFVINAERTEDDDYEADYMWVHFFLPEQSPWFDGSVYIGGDLFGNQLLPTNRMQYDNQHQTYFFTAYLKQGAYDYQYWFKPKQSNTATLLRTEGSHWQTQNEYTIYVYYRPFGGRYDQLVGYTVVER
ncbi:MAG: DUF5103 domain-containing protein [Paludibacteraceae bacterium]